jgi:hypothetical protein
MLLASAAALSADNIYIMSIEIMKNINTKGNSSRKFFFSSSSSPSIYPFIHSFTGSWEYSSYT